jgi:hypothetical protein
VLVRAPQDHTVGLAVVGSVAGCTNQPAADSARARFGPWPKAQSCRRWTRHPPYVPNPVLLDERCCHDWNSAVTGLSLAFVALAVAVLIRPGAALPAARLAALRPATGAAPVRRRRFGQPLPWLAGIAAALLAVACSGGLLWLLAGVPVGLAARWLARTARRNTARKNTADPLRLASCWDLLAACLRGGLPVPVAVQAVAADVPGGGAGALRQTAELLALGADPVAAWAPALAEPVTAELARGARRSARSGAALASVAEQLAGGVRAAADDLAEARAQRAAVAVTGPLGLCFLPAFLCVGVVPVVIGLATRLLASW